MPPSEVIVMECTINNQFGVPLFLATMLAKWVGRRQDGDLKA